MENVWQWVFFINQYFSTTILTLSVLVAVGFGIKQILDVKRGQASIAYQSIINASYELERLYVKYPKLYLGMQKSNEYVEKLPLEERTKLDWVTMMTLDFFDNLIYQKNRKVIKPRSKEWVAWINSIRNEFRRCSYLRGFLKSVPELYTKELILLAND